MKVVLEAAAIALGTAASVTARRLASGSLRPSWSMRTELFGALQRAFTDRSRTRGIPWLRAAQAGLPATLPRELGAVRFSPVSYGSVACEWAIPPGASIDPPARALVYFHGGGFVMGSLATHREIVARLAAGTGMPALAVDYRLAPEHRFPAAHDDCLGVVRWLRERGVEPSRLALAGDSAGGTLAIATLLALRDAGEAMPACAALISPWVDPLADGGSMQTNERFDFGDRDLVLGWARAYASESELGDPRLTPLAADLRGLPPLLVQAGEAEIFLDQIRAFVERARAAGVAVDLDAHPDMFHDFQISVSLVPEGAGAVASLARFLSHHVAG